MFDDVLAFVKVIASSIENDYPLYNVTGTSGIDVVTGATDDSDEAGEGSPSQEQYQSLGTIARPLPPDDDGECEGIAARTADGLAAFGYRDARIHAKFPNPAEGTIAQVSYGGGFHSMDLNPNGETVHTIYAPNAASSLAQAIIVDPDQGISLVEASGYLIFMSDEGILLQAKAGGPGGAGSTDTALILKQGEITITAPSIILQGNVVAGANSVGALPLLPGAASPPSPSFFVSSV